MRKIDQAVAIIRLMSDESLANWIERVNVCPSNFSLENKTVCPEGKCKACWNEEVEE